MRTFFYAFVLVALTKSALADPKLEDVAVVRDSSGHTVLLYPPPSHPLLLDLKSLRSGV